MWDPIHASRTICADIPLLGMLRDWIVTPTRPRPRGFLRHDLLNHGNGLLVFEGCLLEMVVLAPESGFLLGIEVSPHRADEAALRQQVDAALQAVTAMAIEDLSIACLFPCFKWPVDIASLAFQMPKRFCHKRSERRSRRRHRYIQQLFQFVF